MPLWSPQVLFSSAGSSPLTVTWRSVTTSTAPGTAMTASGVSLGPAGDEFIIVSVQGGGGSANAAASCTVEGEAATKIDGTGTGEPGVSMFKIARADVSGATTGDVIATWSSAPGRASIDTASVDGEVGDVTATKEHSTGANTSSVTSDMSVSAGGIVIAAVLHNDGGTSWTENLTEGSDEGPFESVRSSFASGNFATAQTATITATFASNATSSGALFLAIAPA